MNNKVTNKSDLTFAKAVGSIALATVIAFTITILCWTIFGVMPNWNGTGMISVSEVVCATWVSLGICVCMSCLGFACFSEAFATKASMIARFAVFAVLGYGIIAAWVIGSGWCPIEALGTFTLACVLAFAFAGLSVYICSSMTDKKLQQQLDAYKKD